MLHLENFFEKSFALLLTTPIQRQRSQKRLTNPKTSHIVTLEMMQHCNTVNKQTSVIFLHHTIKKASKRL